MTSSTDSFDIIEPHDIVNHRPKLSSSPSPRVRSGAISFVSSEGPCSQCQDNQLALIGAQETNERLLRGLSRIISQLDQAREYLKSLEDACHKKEKVPDHIHLPVEDIYIIDPETIAAKRKENVELGTVIDQMYPRGLDYSDIEEQISKLDKCLKETRETCISSANVCFEGNLFGGKKERPPLKRMNTVHSSSFSQSADKDDSDYMGRHLGLPHQTVLYRLHSQRSERHYHDGSLVGAGVRRTHSETELDSVLVASLVLEGSGHEHTIGTDPKTNTILSTSGSRGILSPTASTCSIQLPFRSHLMSVLGRQEPRESVTSLVGGGTLLRKVSADIEDSNFVQPLGKGLTGESEREREREGD